MQVLKCINYIILELMPLHHFPLSSLPWFLEQFQQLSFLHLHVCVHIICIYSSSYTLSPSVYSLCTHSDLFSNFVGKKENENITFSQFDIKISTQGISLWCLYTYINWFISYGSLHSSRLLFPWWASQFKISVFIAVQQAAYQPHSSFEFPSLTLSLLCTTSP
jgi:hypothetical protein